MTRAKTLHPHITHVHEHLERLASGISITLDEEQIYLGSKDETHFWELVGLRVRGLNTVMLAALRFYRHDHPGEPFARESLATYLSSPPAPLATDMSAARHGEISAYLPRMNETIPNFLQRMRGGVDTAAVHLSPDTVEVAFDFRTGNPFSVDAIRRTVGPMTPHVVRTVAGHVLYGLAHPAAQHQGAFLALTHAHQFTPEGKVTLPPVMLRRDFLVAMLPLGHERTRLAAANWAPFAPAEANPEHLLYL
jgi:hypothetical protein